MTERVAEEAEAIKPAASSLVAVRVAGEAAYHGDVGVHGMPNRRTLRRFDDIVVFLHPLDRLGRVNERKSQRANAVACGFMDGLTPGARDPDRWVRFLHGLRHDVAARHDEILPLISGV